MQVYTGTSGFSYKEWKGSFYPEDLANDKMLGYYAEKLSAVEINNTFYRMPKRTVLESWRDQVPGNFRFVLKASRRITHFKRLKETQDEMGYLLENVKSLENKLGLILFQLPPNLKKDLDRLQKFLELLNDDIHSAFEFRHPSWLDDEVFAALEAKACALCISDADGDESPAPIVATAPRGYLRLRRSDYKPKDIKAWADKVSQQNWHEVFVFFKHEEAGAGPELASRFAKQFK